MHKYYWPIKCTDPEEGHVTDIQQVCKFSVECFNAVDMTHLSISIWFMQVHWEASSSSWACFTSWCSGSCFCCGFSFSFANLTALITKTHRLTTRALLVSVHYDPSYLVANFWMFSVQTNSTASHSTEAFVTFEEVNVVLSPSPRVPWLSLSWFPIPNIQINQFFCHIVILVK